MKLPAVPVHSFEDVTLNFEALMRLLPFAAWASGQATLTWTASNLSATLAVPHGLGRVPTQVIATAFFAPGPGQVPALNTFAYTATTFSMNGDARTSGSFSCAANWLAIG